MPFALLKQPSRPARLAAIVRVESLAPYITDELRAIYEMHGVPINDKHFDENERAVWFASHRDGRIE